MIDIENLVFTNIATPYRAAYPSGVIYGEYVPAPSEFPCLTVEQTGSAVYERTQTMERKENHDTLAYTINVYCNAAKRRKSQAKEIMALVDEQMLRMGFRRASLLPTPNMDTTIYRLTAVYTGIVNSGTLVEGNTVYQIYTS